MLLMNPSHAYYEAAADAGDHLSALGLTQSPPNADADSSGRRDSRGYRKRRTFALL